MSATLRRTSIRRQRRRIAKRRRLRVQIARASAAERPALEIKLAKTYQLLTSDPRNRTNPPRSTGD